jgi:hypothetical protein
MDDSDVVTLETLKRVRAITTREARRVLLVAALAGPIAGAFALLVAYAVYGALQPGVAMIVAGAFVLIGVQQVVHWARHYRSIMRQLDALGIRMSGGELVHGSQVRFHSYR